jgi:hypothetical protein
MLNTFMTTDLQKYKVLYVFLAKMENMIDKMWILFYALKINYKLSNVG